jgi:hypothetical protein
MIVRQRGGRLSRAPFRTASLPNPWPTLRRDDGHYSTRARSFLERGTAASCPRGKLYAARRSARGRVEFLLLVMPTSASSGPGMGTHFCSGRGLKSFSHPVQGMSARFDVGCCRLDGCAYGI